MNASGRSTLQLWRVTIRPGLSTMVPFRSYAIFISIVICAFSCLARSPGPVRFVPIRTDARGCVGMPVTFDLVLTDMTMPRMTGDKLSIELLNIRPDIPIILSTGYSARITVEKALKIGIKDLVFKPVVEAELAVIVRRVPDEERL